MVEYRLAKARVAGSNPVSCFFCVLTDKERMDCQWLPDDMQVLVWSFLVNMENLWNPNNKNATSKIKVEMEFRIIQKTRETGAVYISIIEKKRCYNYKKER